MSNLSCSLNASLSSISHEIPKGFILFNSKSICAYLEIRLPPSCWTLLVARIGRLKCQNLPRGGVPRNNMVGNKNAFQWDAYRPLVDRIPACTVAGGTCPGGEPAQGGCTYPGGCTSLGGVPAQGGVPARGGTCPVTPPPVNRMTDRQV